MFNNEVAPYGVEVHEGWWWGYSIRIALVHNLFVLICFGQGEISEDTRENKEAIKGDREKEKGRREGER